MKFFSRISFMLFGAILAPAAVLCVDKTEVENPFEYLAPDQTAEPERLFNVNTDEMGPAVFMIAQGRFWTVKDVQNALLSLEVVSDTRQQHKVLGDLKKFMEMGAEKYQEESLLKNTIVSQLRGLGQHGHVLADFPGWRMWSDGIAAKPVHADVLEYLKTFVDPWVLAPESKKIVQSRQLAAPELALAVAARKKFEAIPFPFLYRLKESHVVSGSVLKKGFMSVAVLFAAWKLKNTYSSRIAKYTEIVENPACSPQMAALAQQHKHLCGPAIALCTLEGVGDDRSATCIKKIGGADHGVRGGFWTFEQFAAYKKMVLGDVEKLSTVYRKLFDAQEVTVPLMRHRVSVALDLVVPSVSYDPFSMAAKFAALKNRKRAYNNLSENGKELFALYRWAWFFRRTDLSQTCDQSLLGAELTAADIPQKTYADVERIIKNDLVGCDFKLTPFSSVSNHASLQAARSVMFYDNRAQAAECVWRLFGLYDAAKVNAAATLSSANILHGMPFWRVLYNQSLGSKPASPFVFDGVVITQGKDSEFINPFVLACRAQRAYPYPYFGFGQPVQPVPAVVAGGDGAVPVAAAGRRFVAPALQASHDAYLCFESDVTYREGDACKVCDVPAFKSKCGNPLAFSGGGYDEAERAKSVIQFKPNHSSFVLIGGRLQVADPYYAFYGPIVYNGDDVLIFMPSKSTEFAAYLKKSCADGGPEHPGKCFGVNSTYSHDSFPDAWLSLQQLANETGCVIELCQRKVTHATTGAVSYTVSLCCRTPADAKKVRNALKAKNTGLALATA